MSATIDDVIYSTTAREKPAMHFLAKFAFLLLVSFNACQAATFDIITQKKNVIADPVRVDITLSLSQGKDAIQMHNQKATVYASADIKNVDKVAQFITDYKNYKGNIWRGMLFDIRIGFFDSKKNWPGVIYSYDHSLSFDIDKFMGMRRVRRK